MGPLTRRQALGVAAALSSAASAASPPATRPDVGPRFGLGLVTYNTAAKWNLDTILRACRAAEIGAVEFRTTHAHGVEPALDADQRAAVRKKCADAGLVIWGCGTTCEFHAADPDVVRKNVDECRRFAELVRDLGGKGVKVRPNGLVPGKSVAESCRQIGAALRECGRDAAALGVEIWVEVHGPQTQKPALMHSIMRECDHPNVGITWNSNPSDVAGGSVATAFELLRPWLRSCHINDLYKNRTGGYPYRELFRLLRKSGYDRWTLIEIGRTPPDADSGIELLKYYRALWGELAGETAK
jgi:sugar phosphate isomerase/epimerase